MTISPLLRSMPAAALLAGLAFFTSGCSDSQVNAQAAAGKTISQAMKAAEKALEGGTMPSDPEAADKVAQSLRNIAKSLGNLPGATPTQNATASLLAASLNRQASAIDAVAAATIEDQHRRLREIVARAASAAASLDAIATPMERVDFGSTRTALKARRDQAEAQLRNLQGEVKTLESTINQLGKQVEANSEETRRLEQESNGLRVKAREMQARQALPLVEKAAEIDTTNAHKRLDLGKQQAELTILQPQLTAVTAESAGGQSLLAATDAALKSLDKSADGSRKAAGEAKSTAEAIRSAAKKELEGIIHEMDEALEARYAAASGGFEMAAGQASKAGSGVDNSGQDSAKIEAASSRLALGRLMAMRAAFQDDHAILLARLAAAGPGWGQPDYWSAQIKKAQGARDESITKAKEAYQAASDLLEQVKQGVLTNGPELTGLKSRVSAARQELESPGSSGAADSGDAASAGGASSAPAGEGAKTPEELVTFMNQPMSAMTDSGMMGHMYSAKLPREVLTMAVSMAMAMKPLVEAMDTKFGRDPNDGVKLVSAQGDQGEVEQTQLGQTTKLKIAKVNGAWFIDLDSMMASNPALAGLSGGAVPGAAAGAANKMVGAMIQAMKSAAQSVAAKVESGALKNRMEAMNAMQAEMQKAMMNAMGAAGAGAGQPGSSPQ